MGSKILKFLKRFVFAAGILFLILLGLSFTTSPYYAYHWLGTSLAEVNEKPEYIIMLGGGGMPSQSNLMRAWFVVDAAHQFPTSKVIISIPGNLNDSLSTPKRVATDLIKRGISKDRILFEQHGTNTRWQALNLRLLHGRLLTQKSLLIVTSPEHMRRSVLCFQKVGFTKVNALPAFENMLEADLSFDDDKLGGNQLPIPNIGKSKSFRYQFWNHLKYEILIARELAALGYYKLRGWI
ncbi:YdcF family protein [uncultured Sunxiuqinia sp.]|uniref:YdcF family protein n=1 Tax=uncultured Sunxiuqinia sp. TaxID=1573825 RepID=UPI002AA803EE|nr:YdcF family protein [uncultured Sunxiuqinia sp.]